MVYCNNQDSLKIIILSRQLQVYCYPPSREKGENFLNDFYLFPRRLTAVLLVSLGAGAAQAQLNDTGQDTCYDGSALVACTTTNTGDPATYPRQDGRFGRDAAATAGVLPKTGGGAAGFDFTKVCMSGELAGHGNCPASPALGNGPNKWACTKDNITGRVWSLETVQGNWSYATVTYPGTMNATNRCGYSTGWRVPTRRELLSIVDNGTYNPAIDTNYFPNTVGSYYWSADTYKHDPVYAWHVGFDDGGPYAYDKSSDSHVRLVQGEQSVPAFNDNGDDTVTDAATGLVWDRCSWGQTGGDCSGNSVSTHFRAVALGVAVIANAMNSGVGYKGHNDWRLPSKNELESLVDVTKSNPAIDTTAFPNTPIWPSSARYWTSTTYAPDPAAAWSVNFNDGHPVASYGAEPTLVRLVRSGQSFAPSDLLGFLIATNVNPAGGGTVSCAPNPVSSGGNSTCNATPNPGYSFTDWGGDCSGTGACTLSNVTTAKAVTATFSASGGGDPVPIPVVGPWGLSLLAGLLAGIGGLQRWRGRRVRR